MSSFPGGEKSLEGKHKLSKDKAKDDSMGQCSSTLPTWVSGDSLGGMERDPIASYGFERMTLVCVGRVGGIHRMEVKEPT